MFWTGRTQSCSLVQLQILYNTVYMTLSLQLSRETILLTQALYDRNVVYLLYCPELLAISSSTKNWRNLQFA